MADAERVVPLCGCDSIEAAAIAFQSLDDTRLRDLVSALIFTSLKWHSLRRTQKTSQDTPDLEGVETGDRGLRREWWVKTVRPNRGDARLARALDRLLANKPRLPDALLLVMPSDPTDGIVADCVKTARRRGVPYIVVWSRRELQHRLIKERPDLLFSYFGVASSVERSGDIASVHHRLEMKRRIRQDLLMRDDGSSPGLSAQIYEKFKYPKIVVRLADDDSYPNNDPGLARRRGWYEVGTYDFYYDGLEVILTTEQVVVHRDGTWAVVADYSQRVPAGDTLISAFRIGRIPYDQMIDWDVDGDECFSHPQLYCRGGIGRLPFVDQRYCGVEDQFRFTLRPDLMLPR